jgi:hypothetical protein
MKHFRDYLVESERTYSYRIKFAGDVPSEFLKAFKARLDQFDPVKVGDVKTTPIQARTPDFPAYSNERMSTMEVEFRYPAIDAQIRQIAQLLGMDPNRVLMQTPNYSDSNEEERDLIKDQNQELLTDTDFPAPDAKQKALSKDYATGPYDHAVLKNAYRSDFTIAGEKTKPAETTNDIPQGTTSPMSTVKRPPKPATGRNPRG